MSLLESMQTDPVSSLSLRSAIRCQPGDTVRTAILRMREGKLGCAVIVDDDDRPLGIFNEAILRRQLMNSPDVIEQQIEAQMVSRFPWVKTTDSVETVLDAMETNNTRFLVVVGDDDKVVGVTGQKSLMEYVAECFPSEVMVQRIGGKGFPEHREGA
jgi:CBS domain-containing protein